MVNKVEMAKNAVSSDNNAVSLANKAVLPARNLVLPARNVVLPARNVVLPAKRAIQLLLLLIGCVALSLSLLCVPACADAPVKVVLNGKPLVFDVQPAVVKGRTMVPMRAIFEELGAIVNWDGDNEIVTAVKGMDVVKAAIGDENIQINGDYKEMDIAPFVENGRTLVPVRFISEAFGCDVVWDGATNTVNITTSAPAYPGGFVAGLLANRQKIVRMDQVTEYRGHVYAADYLCIPEWESCIESNYIGAFLIANDYIFHTSGNGTGAESAELSYRLLNGDGDDADTLIDYADNWGYRTCLMGDLLVYNKYDSLYEDLPPSGMYGFNVKTFKKTKLCNITDAFTPVAVSFDDECIYLVNRSDSSFWRVKNDGSKLEKVKELDGLPQNELNRLAQCFSARVDGGYIYNVVSGSTKNQYWFYDSGYIGINRIPINNLAEAKYYPLGNEKFDTVLLMQDGWIYLCRDKTIYKMNLGNGQLSKIADMDNDDMFFASGIFLSEDGYLYFCAYVDDMADTHSNTRMYRVNVNGGSVEDTGKKWYES